jgi:type IV pilus assembly protein PilC
MFVYRGVAAGGAQVSGELEAQDPRGAARQLRDRQIRVITVAPKRESALKVSFRLGGGVKGKHITVFSRQFSTMISAGLPLVQCLESLATQAESKHFGDIITKIADDVKGGTTLSDAMRKHPKVFNELYVNLVKVGETGGVLDTVLNRLSGYLEKAMALKRKVRMALMYPATVMIVAVVVVIFILTFVIPVFAGVYKKMGAELPLPTQIVLLLSDLILGWWYLVLAAMIGVVFLLRAYYKTGSGKLQVHRLLLRLPVLGPLVRKIAVARFTRTLGVLLGSGVPILDGLAITAKTAGNKVVENAVIAARTSITAGQTVAAPLKESGVFPPMVIQMVSVGEQTGAMESMLSKVADYYEEEVDTAVAGLTSLLEPVLIVFLGVVVGGIVISMYLPIFKLITVIK